MVLAIDFYRSLGGLASAINVFIAASTVTLFLNTVTIIFNKIYSKLDKAGDLRYNHTNNGNPYQLTSIQLFPTLCFNDVILHFINLIQIYGPTVLNLKELQHHKENFQLVIDKVDYIVFALDKFDDFRKYQVFLNNVNITSDDDAIMDKVFEAIPIPEEWRFMVVFKGEILEETVFVNFGDTGGSRTKVCELNDSLTKFCELPIFNESLFVDPDTRLTRARYLYDNIESYTGQEDNNWIPYSVSINENKSCIVNNWWIADPFPIP